MSDKSNIESWMIEIFKRYMSPEITTVIGTQPSTFPLLVYYSERSNKFYFTSSPGLSKKFKHMRENNRVSIFYADPRESGLNTEATILVQGKVLIYDDIEKNHQKIKQKLKWYLSRQPKSKFLVKPGILGWIYRKIMWWYPYRLLAELEPTKIIAKETSDSSPIIVKFEESETMETKINPKEPISLVEEDLRFIQKQSFVTVSFIDTTGYPNAFRSDYNIKSDRIELNPLSNYGIKEYQRLCLLAQDFDYKLDRLNYLHIKGHRQGEMFIPTYKHSMYENLRSLLKIGKLASSRTRSYFQNQNRNPPKLDLILSKEEFNKLEKEVNLIISKRTSTTV